ncbi:MAG: PilZ domain-containing protein [Thermoanaerobaculia bacterium]|jgi:hypothetical protein
MADQEKRRLQRLDLVPPSDAKLSGLAVVMLDLSTAGARVEHPFPMKAGQHGRLDFTWNGSSLSLECEIVRTRLQKSTIKAGVIVYHSGLRFTDPSEGSRAQVRNIVAAMASAARAASSSATG